MTTVPAEEQKEQSLEEAPKRGHSLRYWLTLPFRNALTAFAFALFGLGGVVFGLCLTPWLKASGRSNAEKRSLARRVVKRWFGMFVSIIERLGLVKVVVKNPEAFEKRGAILAANHPSLIDVVCLISIVPEATTIVKSALLSNWFTRAPIKGAGYIANNAGPEALNDLAIELDRGAVFVIFPEGTRTPTHFTEMPKMHRGAAQLALHSGRAITPVRIEASPRWLTKDVAWWHLPEEPMTLTFEALPEIDVEPFRSTYNHSSRRAAVLLTDAVGRALFPEQSASSKGSSD